MKSLNDKQIFLPAISSNRSQHKPIKQILQNLKQRKALIQSRIKTQIQQKQIENQQQLQNLTELKQRVITEIPYFLNQRIYSNRMNRFSSLGQVSMQHSKQQKQQLTRLSHNITQSRNKNILLSPLQKKQKIQAYFIPKSRKSMIKQILQICAQIPIDPRQRTQTDIQLLKLYLTQNNIFFNKIHPIVATCILKLNKLIWIQNNHNLYRIGEQKNRFYIILCGHLKIYDHEHDIMKICNAGQSIAQQLLFVKKFKKQVKETAKSLSKCFLVQIKLDNYKKMGQEMIRYGYKTIFNQMESILKRNFIMKNWIRGQRQIKLKRY